MCSSRVRRQARRFFQSALKGAGSTRRRGLRTVRVCCVLWNQAPEKASNRAEKSGGSKPRRLRGLRKGKRRSRGGKPRRSVPPATLTNNCSNRSLSKVLSQLDFWADRTNLVYDRLRKSRALTKWSSKGPRALTDSDWVSVNRSRRLYGKLRRRKLAAHKAVRIDTPSWRFVLEKQLGIVGKGSALSVLQDLELQFYYAHRTLPVIPEKKTSGNTRPPPRGRTSKQNSSGRVRWSCPACHQPTCGSRSKVGGWCSQAGVWTNRHT